MGAYGKLKPRIAAMLAAPDWERRLVDLEDTPAKQCVGPLLSLLLRGGETTWRAVTALGVTVARLADMSLEQGREVMRQLMWYLNEESGGVGWGVPEVMGEILARHEGLAREYHSILVSYITDTGRHGNYLDHAPLRRGAFWGVARLAQVRPDLVASAAPALRAALSTAVFPPAPSCPSSQASAALPESTDPAIPGLAAWALGLIQAADAADDLASLAQDPTPCELFRDGALQSLTVGALAREALARIQAKA